MNYSVQNLTQVADCNALLTWAAQERADLDLKRHSNEHASDKFALTSQEVEVLLLAVNTDLASVESVIATLADGPYRKEQINKKKRLEFKKFLLENRRESYGTVTLLEKQMDLACVKLSIDEVDAFIVAVEAQKATLPG